MTMHSIDGFPRDPNKNKPLTASYNQTQILTFNRALQKNNIQAFNHLTITYLTPHKKIPEKQKMEMKQRKIDEYLQEIENKPDDNRRDKIFPDLVITTTDRSNDKVEHLLFCQNFMVISQSPVLIKWWRTERVNRMNKSPGLMYNILPMPEFDVNYQNMSDTDLPKSDQNFADFEADFDTNNDDNFGTFDDFPNENTANDDFADFGEAKEDNNFGDFDAEFPVNTQDEAEFDAFGGSNGFDNEQNDQSFGNFDDPQPITKQTQHELEPEPIIIEIPTIHEFKTALKTINPPSNRTLEQIKSKNNVHKKMVDYIHNCTKNGDVDGLNDKLFIDEDNYLCSLNSALMCTSNQPVFDYKYEKTKACEKYQEVREKVLNQQ